MDSNMLQPVTELSDAEPVEMKSQNDDNPPGYPLKCARVHDLEQLRDKRLPNYGGILPGSDLVGEFKPPWKVAPTCGSLNMRLVPEPKRGAKNIKNAKRGSPKLLTEPRIVDSSGTVRVFGSTVSANQKYLSLRGSGDFANQVFWWDAYKAACKAEGLPRGRFLIPEVGEWLAGLPEGWTLAAPGSVNKRRFTELFPHHGRAPYKVWSCFSGVLGLELGLSELVQAVGYVESNAYCQDVIKCRIRDGLAAPGPVHSDIMTFSPPPGEVDGVCGGFPCQGVSRAGLGLGIEDERSMLVVQLVRVVDESEAWFALLENVVALLSADRRPVMDYLLKEFAARDMHVYWATTSGKMVGVHVQRPRVFMVACKSSRVPDLMKDLKVMSVQQMEAQCHRVWNPRNKPKLAYWLKAQQTEHDKQRLAALGNIVFPKCAQLGAHLLAKQMSQG